MESQEKDLCLRNPNGAWHYDVIINFVFTIEVHWLK